MYQQYFIQYLIDSEINSNKPGFYIETSLIILSVLSVFFPISMDYLLLVLVLVNFLSLLVSLKRIFEQYKYRLYLIENFVDVAKGVCIGCLIVTNGQTQTYLFYFIIFACFLRLVLQLQVLECVRKFEYRIKIISIKGIGIILVQAYVFAAFFVIIEIFEIKDFDSFWIYFSAFVFNMLMIIHFLKEFNFADFESVHIMRSRKTIVRFIIQGQTSFKVFYKTLHYDCAKYEKNVAQRYKTNKVSLQELPKSLKKLKKLLENDSIDSLKQTFSKQFLLLSEILDKIQISKNKTRSNLV